MGDTTDRSVPVQVGTDTNWASAAAGLGHTVAVKTNGTLWAWGNNSNGQLGLGVGDTTDRSVPVQVGTDTLWASVAAGSMDTVAVKTNGTLWAWGCNVQGSLGNGAFGGGQNPTPAQVGIETLWASTLWASVAEGDMDTLAVKTDGTLWAWGNNSNGQLGDGTINNSPTPGAVSGIY